MAALGKASKVVHELMEVLVVASEVVSELMDVFRLLLDTACGLTDALGVTSEAFQELMDDLDVILESFLELLDSLDITLEVWVVGVTKAAVVVTESDNKVTEAVDVTLKAKVVDKISDRINRGELRELLVVGNETDELTEAFGEVVEAIGVVSRTIVDATETSDVDTGALMETVSDPLDVVGVVEGKADEALELITEVA